MRKVADCRDFPSVNNCTLTISGEENEVLLAAMDHAVAVHGHLRDAELEADIRKMLRDEVGPRITEPMQAPATAQPRH